MLFGRQPAFWIGVIVSSILAVLSVLTTDGVLSEALSGQITDGVNAVAQILVLLAPIITGLLIRTQVTPVASPKLPTGTTVEVVSPDAFPNQRMTL